MSMEKKYIIFSLLEFLKDENDENLNVAIQSIEKKYGITLENSEYKLSLPFEHLFKEGVRCCGIKTDVFDYQDDEEYHTFIKLLTEKTYFGDFPKDSEIYQQRMKKANEAYLLKLQREKIQAEEFKTKGNEFLRGKKFEQALEMYEKAIKLHKKNPIFHTNKAVVLTQLSRFDDAHKCCDDAIAVDKYYAKAYVRHGILYTRQNKFTEAITWFEKAKVVDPEHSEDYEKRVRSAETLKRRKEKESEKKPPPTQNRPSMPGMPNLGGMNIGNMGQILNNPQFMQMAENMMQQPQFRNMVGNIMGNLGNQDGDNEGSGNMGGLGELFTNPENNPFYNAPVPEETIEELKLLPEVQRSEKLQKVVEKLRTEGISAVLSQMNDPEVAQLMKKLSNDALKKMYPGNSDGESKDDFKKDDPPPGVI